ncbi:MAG: hypothetical protein WC847_01190 [Candidatus Paceibacterota bacterium]|jgi:hypothetical protein
MKYKSLKIIVLAVFVLLTAVLVKPINVSAYVCVASQVPLYSCWTSTRLDHCVTEGQAPNITYCPVGTTCTVAPDGSSGFCEEAPTVGGVCRITVAGTCNYTESCYGNSGGAPESIQVDLYNITGVHTKVAWKGATVTTSGTLSPGQTDNISCECNSSTTSNVRYETVSCPATTFPISTVVNGPGTITPSSQSVPPGTSTTFTKTGAIISVTSSDELKAPLGGWGAAGNPAETNTNVYTTGNIAGAGTYTFYFASASAPVVTLTANPISGTVNVVNPTLTWSATNSPTSCTASGDWSGLKAVSGTNVSQGVLTSVKLYSYTLTCTNAAGSGSATATVNVTTAPPPMSGTLTASDCFITAGNSSCLTTLNWTTTNPQGISSVTTPTNVTVPNSNFNSGSTTYPIVPGIGSRDFYLYNNTVQLAGPVWAAASCASGTAWDGVSGTCKTVPGMSGTLTPSPSSCIISVGASACNVSLTWTTTSPTTVGGSTVSSAGGGTEGFGDNGGPQSFNVPKGGRTFYLYNTGVELASSAASANCISGSVWDPVLGSCQSGAMTGTLTPMTSSCVIASGASTCNINFSWTTTNPVAISKVTKPVNVTVATGNTGSKVPFAIKWGGETFYLYNNGIPLASSTVNATSVTCASGTGWDVPTGTCKTITGMSGTLVPSTSVCTIPLNASTCNVNLGWSINNPEASPTKITASGMSDVVVSNSTLPSSQSGNALFFTVPYLGRTFYLYNNAKSLVPSAEYPSGSGVSVTTVCSQTPTPTAWIGGKCTASSCANGAIDAGTCSQCPDGLAYLSSACVPCSNGGCTGPGGNSNNPLGSLACINGASNPIACDLTNAGGGVCGVAHYACVPSSTSSTNRTSSTSKWTWKCGTTACTELKKKPIFIEN